ncbi:MAG TPA: shikimate kinase [Cellvibrionaceae bacterium]
MTTATGNLILIGMPAVGKSTLGVLLAKELVREFVDTDLTIQTREGRALEDILKEDGHLMLRQIEAAVLKTVNATNSIIATGGSAIYSDEAMVHLKSLGQVVHLHLPLEAILQRIDNPVGRGIAKSADQTLADMYAERQPLYQRYADITIDCRGKTPAQLVAEIIYEEGEYYGDMDA